MSAPFVDQVARVIGDDLYRRALHNYHADHGRAAGGAPTVHDMAQHVVDALRLERYQQLIDAGNALVGSIRRLDSYSQSTQVCSVEATEQAATAILAWGEALDA